MRLVSPRSWAAWAGVVAIVGLSPKGLCESERFEETRDTTVAHVEHRPIAVETANGSISIAVHEGREVEITAKLVSKSRERLDQARVAVERGENETLTIRCEWPGGKPKRGDGCSFSVLVPDAFGVKADTANGSIAISGLAGDLVADTSNGSINVTGHDGAIDADTGNGSIKIEDVTGTVRADTSNGSIGVVLADDNPGPVDLDTSNGSVRLEVGTAFVGAVHGDTSVGRASVGTFPAGMSVEITERSKTSFRAVFGGRAAPKSSLETSVGSVTVQARS